MTEAVLVGLGALLSGLIGVRIYAYFNGRRTSAPVQSDEARALAKRLDDVEDDVANLDRRFMRLRGQVTGSLRRMYDEPEYDDEPPEEPE